MQNLEQTIISQYANSPTLLALINNMNACLDPQANMDLFYNYIWNIETAEGFGLDILGRIIGISRIVTIPSSSFFFGYQDGGAQDYGPFNQAPFYIRPESITSATGFNLSDMAFRTLILVKALSNISNCSARSINTLLQNLFAGRGKCYVLDKGGMQMTYVFEFYLAPYEKAILTNTNALLHPAGVGVNIEIVATANTLGFKEGAPIAPFNQGVLYAGQ